MSEGAEIPRANEVASMPASYQEVLSEAPYRLRRRVRWADCDAGNIVYTPNFLDYAVETVESWFEATMGVHWSRIAPDLGIGHPFVRCELDFHRMLSCGDAFLMTLNVEAVNRSSYAVVVSGDDLAGTRCFDARLIAAWISIETNAAIAIPEPYRQRIDAYRRAAAIDAGGETRRDA